MIEQNDATFWIVRGPTAQLDEVGDILMTK